MIKGMKPISMAEATQYLGEDAAEAKAFISNFTELDSEGAKTLRNDLEALDLIKLNEKNVSKIIDTLPQDKEDLGKILNDTNLDENETNSVLAAIK